MKKLISTTLLATTILIPAAQATPFNGVYLGAEAGYENFDASGTFTGAGLLAGHLLTGNGSLSGAMGGIYGGYGKTSNKWYFGIEGQADLANANHSVTANGVTSTVKNTSNFGISLRPGYTPTENLLLYTRLGWENSHFEGNVSGLLTGGTSANPSGVSTGLGAEYALTSNLTARLDWMYVKYQNVSLTNYYNGANIGTTTISPVANTFRVGLAYNF